MFKLDYPKKTTYLSSKQGSELIISYDLILKIYMVNEFM